MKQVLKQKDYKKLELVIKNLANEEVISIQKVMDLTQKSRTTAWRYMQLSILDSLHINIKKICTNPTSILDFLHINSYNNMQKRRFLYEKI